MNHLTTDQYRSILFSDGKEVSLPKCILSNMEFFEDLFTTFEGRDEPKTIDLTHTDIHSLDFERYIEVGMWMDINNEGEKRDYMTKKQRVDVMSRMKHVHDYFRSKLEYTWPMIFDLYIFDDEFTNSTLYQKCKANKKDVYDPSFIEEIKEYWNCPSTSDGKEV